MSAPNVNVALCEVVFDIDDVAPVSADEFVRLYLKKVLSHEAKCWSRRVLNESRLLGSDVLKRNGDRPLPGSTQSEDIAVVQLGRG